MIAVLTISAIVGFTLPHLPRLRGLTPITASVIWTCALTLRGLTAVLAAGWLVLYFPSTGVFEALTHWCWKHLASADINGHDVGHVTTLVPVAFGVLSLASLLIGTVKVARAPSRGSIQRPGPSRQRDRRWTRRRHRYVLVYAEMCHALAHILPGTGTAIEELAFHLERDADRRALARRVDRQALAAALTKAATVRIERRAVAMALGGSRRSRRITSR